MDKGHHTGKKLTVAWILTMHLILRLRTMHPFQLNLLHSTMIYTLYLGHTIIDNKLFNVYFNEHTNKEILVFKQHIQNTNQLTLPL